MHRHNVLQKSLQPLSIKTIHGKSDRTKAFMFEICSILHVTLHEIFKLPMLVLCQLPLLDWQQIPAAVKSMSSLFINHDMEKTDLVCNRQNKNPTPYLPSPVHALTMATTDNCYWRTTNKCQPTNLQIAHMNWQNCLYFADNIMHL